MKTAYLSLLGFERYDVKGNTVKLHPKFPRSILYGTIGNGFIPLIGYMYIWGASNIVFRNRFLCGFMFVYILYIIYIYMYIYICQGGGAVGFVDFTKLSFALS